MVYAIIYMGEMQACVSAGYQRGQENVSDSLELELELRWALGTERRSSARAVRSFNICAIFPCP